MVEVDVSEYTIGDFIQDMHPSILSYSRPKSSYHPYVFWSRGGGEGENYCSGNSQNIQDHLISALSDLGSKNSNVLVQFWVPTWTTWGGCVLTTSNQPFGLKRIERGLCEYRMRCSILEINVNAHGRDDKSGVGSLIARVYKQEESFDACKYYHTKHQTWSNFACKCNIERSLIMPLFLKKNHQLFGVLELVVTDVNSFMFDDLLALAKDITMECCSAPTWPLSLQMKESTQEDGVIRKEMNKAMQVICTKLQLPLVRIWIPGCTTIAITYADSPNKSCCSSPYLSCSIVLSSSIDCDRFETIDAAGSIGKDQGRVFEALLYHKPSFCKDISQAAYWLTRWYTICMHSNTTRTKNSCDYVLEIYPPPKWNSISEDPKMFLKSMLAMMKKQLPGFEICPAGEEPCVVVVGTKGLNVAIAEESSVPVPSSRRKKSSRAESTKSVYTVKGIPIRREDLIELKDLKRQEAADKLGIGKTSLQDACRYFGIMTWPPGNMVLTASACHVKNVVEEKMVAKKRKKINSLCSNYPPPVNAAHPIPNVTPQKDAETVATYLSYRDNTFVFRFPISSTVPLLREMLGKRCSLDEGSFEIKYRDNMNKLISIADKADLEEFISTLRSLGEKSADIDLMVLPIADEEDLEEFIN